MPSYCDNTPEISSVPPQALMVYYKPYFNTPVGANKLIVKIKVPSNCYFVEDEHTGYPNEGTCGDPSDYNHMIILNKTPDCTNSTDHVCEVTLPYTADTNGQKLVIYVQDLSTADGAIRGGSKSSAKMVF